MAKRRANHEGSIFFSDTEKSRIETAVKAAESRTCGEIVPMVIDASYDYPRAEILGGLWDESPVGDERSIDVHVHNMREKLEIDPKEPEYLLTVRGYGYRLREA